MENTKSTANTLHEQISQLQTAIANAKTQGDGTSVIELQKKLGQFFMEEGDAPQALTAFNEAIKLLTPENENKESLAQLFGLRGLALKLIGNYTQALQAFRKSNKTAEEIGHMALTCDSFIQIASLYLDMNKSSEAVSTLKKAAKVAETSRDRSRRMRIFGLLGDAYLNDSEVSKASEYFRQALETAQDTSNRAAECAYVTKLGNIYLMTGELEHAKEKYERALRIASAIEDRNAEINILGGLFRTNALAGEIYAAQVYGEQVIHLAAQINHLEAEAANIQAVAAYLIEIGQMEKTNGLLERGLQLAQTYSNLGLEIDIHILYAQAYASQKKYTEAQASWDTALSKANLLQDELLTATILSQKAAVYAESAALDQSIQCAETALAIALNLENNTLAAQQQILLAFNFSDLGQKEKAAAYCQAAFSLFDAAGDQEMALQAQNLLAQITSENL